MSRDVYDIINFRELEHTLIYQCAPVLSGLKISNLLILDREMISAALRIIRAIGLSWAVMYQNDRKVTYLIYHRDRLERILRDSKNMLFFRERGFSSGSLHDAIQEVSSRYTACMEGTAGFPDELGLFLGYPIGDVIGYIEHGGKDYLLNGYWKVYTDPDTAAALFQCYDAITEKMMRELLSGVSIMKVIADNRIGDDIYSHSYAV